MTTKLENLEEDLRASRGEWRWHAACVIEDIPSGYICSYGEIANETNRRTGLNVIGRNIAWLRNYLYEKTNRDTTIPLHRVAKSGDI
jgi:alkylated DNA nucleotide flippase Atl1